MRWKPGVRRRLLALLAGLCWLGVGIYLLGLALTWTGRMAGWRAAWVVLAGGCMAPVFAFLALSPALRRNLMRLDRLPERVCVFAFQDWRSYLIVLVMIAAGIALRHSSLPRPVLAALYIGIGGGLLLASLGYFRHFLARPREG